MSLGRQAAAGALSVLALTCGALWLVGRLEGAEVARGAAGRQPGTAEATPPAPLPGPTLTPPEVADPAQARALELLLERRAAYQSMEDGFKGPEAPAALARLEPALLAHWPRGGPVRWRATCRGEACRLEVEGGPEGWGATLTGHPALKAVVDRVVEDPDRPGRPVYLLLAAERARPGAALLDGVARAIEEGGEAAACLRGAPPGTAVTLELEVDGTGITFRAAGGSSGAQRECVAGAVGDVLASTAVEPGARRAARTVVVRAPP